MTGWEYRKMDLNQLPRETNDVDLLNHAGEEGWELVTILPNNVAYLKRDIEAALSDHALHNEDGPPAEQLENVDPDGTVPAPGRVYEVKAKYRDPETNETWSGRGRMATWLKHKQDAGEDIEKYRV